MIRVHADVVSAQASLRLCLRSSWNCPSGSFDCGGNRGALLVAQDHDKRTTNVRGQIQFIQKLFERNE